MIIGEYPCCDGSLCLSLPNVELPKFEKEICPHCGQIVWHEYSRIDPQTWTEAGFLLGYVVDENSKKITRKEIQ